MTRKNKSTLADVAVGAVAIVGVVALIAGLYALAALLFMFAWNVGVDALVTASGGSVGDIGFLPALGGVFAISFVRSLLGRDRPTTVEKKG